MPGFADVVGNLPPLPELILWRDPVARSAAEAMAVDEALLEWLSLIHISEPTRH